MVATNIECVLPIIIVVSFYFCLPFLLRNLLCTLPATKCSRKEGTQIIMKTVWKQPLSDMETLFATELADDAVEEVSSPFPSYYPTVSERGSNKSVELLDIFLCGFIDMPESGEECSQRIVHRCVRCQVRGGYITGESIDEFGAGHMICRVVWYFALLVAFVGVLANALIIVIIRRRKSDRTFDFLLRFLANVDLCCCLVTFFSSTASVAYFENWFGRRLATMYWIYVACLTLLMLRSLSIFVTLLITIERYFVIAFPLHTLVWFSKARTKMVTLITVFLSILISVPRYSSLYIGPNFYGSQPGGLDIPSLRHLSHVYLPTRLYHFWEMTLFGFHNQIEYWIPIPLLLLFNYLSYKKVKRLSEKRHRMNCTQRRELQAARMFIPVVVLLLTCNLWPTLAFVIMHFWGVFHREMWMVWTLTIAANSAVNFWIYYYRAKTFKAETRQLMSQLVLKISDHSLLSSLGESYKQPHTSSDTQSRRPSQWASVSAASSSQQRQETV